MAGRVWRAVPSKRGEWEIEVTEPSGARKIAGFVVLTDPIVRPSLQMQRIMQTIAAEQGGTVAGTPGVDWVKLGWDDQTEHDQLVAELERIVRSWRGHPHDMHRLRYVNVGKGERGIPNGPPYSIDQADALDQLVRRAPAVVDQDLAAEGTAA
jgi:hypothetical protein